jgi:hypothetical protein
MINFSDEAWRLISGRHIRGAIAMLVFASSLSITSIANAQTDPESQAACEEKCSNEEKQCLNAQSSEELCDYDYKQCAKACEKK